jgi:hypothetical protein
MQEVESLKDRERAEDRRRYRRHTGIPAVVEVAGSVWTVVDVSLGGFGARTTEALPREGDSVSGEIVGNGRDGPFRIGFEGRVVRVDPGNRFVGVQFGDLSNAAFDRLMHVLAVLEEEWVSRIERLDRQKRMAELRRSLVRAAGVLALVSGAAVVLAVILSP